MRKINLYLLAVLTMVAGKQYLNAQELIWAKQLGGTNHDNGRSIAVDNLGNVYTTGIFQGTADFDPGPGIYNLTSAGSEEIFISKLDASGDFVWAKQLGGASLDRGFSIAVDDNGNVYTTGYFWGTADFDPGAGVFNLTSAGSYDVFVSKLDVAGNFMWAKQLGGASVDYANSLAVDPSGDIYITGRFQGISDFDPGAGTFNLTSAGNYDIFISKLDASGNFVWAKQFGGTSIEDSFSVAVDASGNVYTTGSFEGTADFDPGIGVFNLTSLGNSDIFISKLDASGNFVWAQQLGGADIDYAYSVTVDLSGNVFTTGIFQGISDFDPGAGAFNLTSVGSYDIFISKLDASGNFVWVKQQGGVNDDYGYSVVTDAAGNVYTTGAFEGIVDFDPGTPTYNLNSVDVYDAYISKLDADGNFVWAKHLGGDGNERAYFITADSGGNLYTTGFFAETTDFDPGSGILNLTSAGSGDVFVHKMSQCSASSSSISVTACSSFISPSNNFTWTSSGTYQDTIPNTAGCDSVMTVNLTILSPTTNSINESTCSSYTVPSGDKTYSVSGVYHDTIPNTVGCDSVITIDLTVNTVDASVTQNQTTLTANTSGLNYQWIDCNNGNTLISGETGQSFTPVSNGSYAVIVDNGLCTDTSDCVEILSLALNQNAQGLSIYPNPTTGQFYIINEGPLVIEKITVTDVTGKIILEQRNLNGGSVIDLTGFADGLYMINCMYGKSNSSFKILLKK